MQHAIYWTELGIRFFAFMFLRFFLFVVVVAAAVIVLFIFSILYTIHIYLYAWFNITCAWFSHTHIEQRNLCSKFVSVFAYMCEYVCVYICAILQKKSVLFCMRSSCLHVCRCFAHMNRFRLVVRFGNILFIYHCRHRCCRCRRRWCYRQTTASIHILFYFPLFSAFNFCKRSMSLNYFDCMW